MDVREKLVELLDEAEEWADHKCDVLDCETCYAGKMKGNCVQKLMVDRLIDHGVTVQECGHWISLTECANAGVYCSVCHKKVYKEDYAWCNRKNKLRSDYCPHCGAKMTPQPPKGE